jgi:hypothetical protein
MSPTRDVEQIDARKLVGLNALLSKVNSDYALPRRSLVDESLLQRANDVAPGGRTVMVYWRAGQGLVAADDPKA